MNPEPFYFGPGHRPLLGWFHAPGGAWRDTAIVLCPPLGYQHLASYRTMRMLAARLSGLGFAVVRFDYPGMGDSGGDEHESGLVRDWIEAIHLAGAEARRLSGATRTAAVGLGVGGMLAATAGSQHPFDALVLWAPVESGRKFIRELRLLQAAGENATSVVGGLEAGGFVYPDALVHDIEALELVPPGVAPAPRVLLAVRDDLPPLHRVEERLRDAGADVTVAPMPGMQLLLDVATIAVIPPETAIGRIADWISRTFPAGGTRPESGTELTTRATLKVAASTAAVIEEAAIIGTDGLFGIVTEPVELPAKETALLLLNTGRDRHIGTSRMWVRLGRAWAADGFRVLRMDFTGLGDSPAREGGQADASYSPHALRDIREAVEFLQSRGATSVIPMGLCSGGYWAVLAAGGDLPLAGICAVNPQLYWRRGEPEDFGATLYAVHEMRRMTRSAASAGKWLRLLTGRVSLFKVAPIAWRRLVPSAGARQLKRRARAAIEDLRKLLGLPRTSLLVYAVNDRGLSFLLRYERRAIQRISATSRVRIEQIPGADHSFTGAGPRMVLEKMLYQHVMDVAGGELRAES